MANESAGRAHEAQLIKELNEVGYALYKLQPTVSIIVPVGGRMARVDVHRAKPRSAEVLQDALRELDILESNFAVELALPVEGWRATLDNWWHRSRLEMLSRRADALLRQVTGEQSILITYHDMPSLAVQAVKVKLAAVALIAVGER
ncbi:hypothetical protein [Caballeronia zhejiangensis]|uniref:hypothetical protein n=1 Tax=Caballeronia zhejiangensis TaxID=871203 RepID=UPI001EF4CE14|nr:hypothetical protein [Caballeronia zhejiangensis]MCG7399694.1 hypothetical protein [Caballeronia zhejiangensis]